MKARKRRLGRRGRTLSSVTCEWERVVFSWVEDWTISYRLGYMYIAHFGLLLYQYRSNKERPLDCWRQVEAFKASVGKLEHVSWEPRHVVEVLGNLLLIQGRPSSPFAGVRGVPEIDVECYSYLVDHMTYIGWKWFACPQRLPMRKMYLICRRTSPELPVDPCKCSHLMPLACYSEMHTRS